MLEMRECVKQVLNSSLAMMYWDTGTQVLDALGFGDENFGNDKLLLRRHSDYWNRRY